MKLLCWNIGIKIDNTDEIIDFISKNDYQILAFQEALKARDKNAYKMYRTKNDIENKFITSFPYTAFAPVWGSEAIIKHGKISRILVVSLNKDVS